MGMNAKAALNSLLGLCNKVQQISFSGDPQADPLISESRKRAKQIHLERINEMVYLVHKPPHNERPQLDLVFFHGLEVRNSNQAHVKTWMSRDDSEFWPQTWLAQSFPNARIFTVSYTSSGPLDMYLTAENLLSSLASGDHRVGKAGCPVVFIGHCLGGLILKELCIFASDTMSRNSPDKLGMQGVRDLFLNFRGAFLYGTPHSGSALGDVLRDLFKGEGAPIEEIQILKASNARRNKHFEDLKSRYNWRTFGIGETTETYLQMLGQGVLVSAEASTRPFMDRYYTVNADHHDICKPKDTTDNAFQSLEQFLKEIQKGGVLHVGEKADLISGRKYVVDREGRAKKLQEKLAQRDVRTIFILGLSGVGKTTLAQQVFHNLSKNYDVLCFVCLDTINSSEQGARENVVMRIVRQLGEADKGFEQNRSTMIYQLKGRKVLMVLDNVELKVQLRALSTEEWLEGSLSKLIITTNSPSVVDSLSTVFRVEDMSDRESRELFNHYAFGGQERPDHLRRVIEQVIDLCGNHPLSLEVVASFVGNMDYSKEGKWLELIRKLKIAEEVDAGREYKIWRKFEVLYEDLPDTEKEIFLDVATFFHDYRLSLVQCIWEGRWGYAMEGSWDTLKRRFLVVENRWQPGCIHMHQLLRSLGENIARRPQKRINKWTRIPEASAFWEEIEYLEWKLEALALRVELRENMMVQEKTLLKCRRLQYLILEGVGTTPNRLELPKSLVYLRLEQGLFTACPVDFTELKKLVVLELVRCRNMEFLAPGLVNVKELKWLDLEGCLRLKKLPSGLSEKLLYLGLDGVPLEKLPDDLERFKNLDRLVVNSPQLTQVPEGVGKMESLRKLDLSHTNVTILPETLGGLQRLETLNLWDTRLTSLPDVAGLCNLTHLKLNGTPVETLPDSIGRLTHLELLNLGNTKLKRLPESVTNLCELQTLRLGNTPLEMLPDSIGKLQCLWELDLRGTRIRTLPDTLRNLSQLHMLYVSSTEWLEWPESFADLNPFVLEGPASSIRCTPAAASECEDVEVLSGRPSSLTSEAEEEGTRASSSAYSVPSDEVEGEEDREMYLSAGMFKTNSNAFSRLTELTLNGRRCPPSWLRRMFHEMTRRPQAVKYLILEDFTLAEEMPSEIEIFSSLRKLVVSGWGRLRELPESVGRLFSLEQLSLRDNPRLEKLPESAGSLPALVQLSIYKCKRLQTMPRSFRRESPLDELFDMGQFSHVASDSWKVLEGFFQCCGKRIPQELTFSLWGEGQGTKGWVQRHFNEACWHGHRMSVAEGNMMVGCGLHDFKKSLVLTGNPDDERGDVYLNQSVIETVL